MVKQDVSKIVAGLQVEGLAVIGLRGRDRLLRFLPEPGGLRLIGVRLGDLLEGLVALLPGDEGTHQVQAHQVAMAPDARGQAGPGLAQPLRLHVEVADRQQEVGRGLLGIGLQGRVEGTNGVGEPAAEDQLATVEEVVQRGHGLDQAGFSILAVPAREVARALEALGAAAVVRGGRLRAKPDRPVEDPQSLGRRPPPATRSRAGRSNRRPPWPSRYPSTRPATAPPGSRRRRPPAGSWA